jgi:broad specificity phosphatase PhoE/ADP-ribose pyrophosphatase YjhB (NUDIX family)
MANKTLDLTAGGVVVRQHRKKGLQVLVSHRPRYDDWTLPKGHLETGETPLSAALREVQEETGLICFPHEHLGSTQYILPSGKNKHVDYWAMERIGGRFRANSEVDEVRWLSKKQARQLLTYSHDQDLVRLMPKSYLADNPLLFLARHAHAGDRTRWIGDDSVRGLSPKGQRQAKTLAKRLQHGGITRLISSPYGRCVETLAPLSQRLGINVETHKGLAETGTEKALESLVDEVKQERVVLSTHGNIVPAILRLLLSDGLKLNSSYQSEKASLWAIKFQDGEPAEASYAPPP